MKDYKTDEEDFSNSINELERLSCLAHDEVQSNYALCTTLWSEAEGLNSINALTKYCEGNYPTALQSLTGSILKFGVYGA